MAPAGRASRVVGRRRHRRRRPCEGAGSPQGARSRWQALTILARPQDVLGADDTPPFFDDLRDTVEVEARPAPSEKGIELHARLRGPSTPAMRAGRRSCCTRTPCHRPADPIEADPTPNRTPAPNRPDNRGTPMGDRISCPPDGRASTSPSGSLSAWAWSWPVH